MFELTEKTQTKSKKQTMSGLNQFYWAFNPVDSRLTVFRYSSCEWALLVFEEITVSI